VTVSDAVAAELERRAVLSGRKLASLCSWELTKAAGSAVTGTEASAVAVPVNIPGLMRASDLVVPRRLPDEGVDPVTGEIEEELPWLPQLGRFATAKDFEDPNFDVEDYQ